MAVIIDRFYGTGRRKTSVARVWVRPGPGRTQTRATDVLRRPVP